MATETQRGSVIRQCEQCGKAFSVFLSTLSAGKGTCCSRTCRDKLRIGKPSPKSKTRVDKKPRIPHVCKWCGKVFVSTSHAGADKPRQYCSNKCLGLSKRKNGREHPRRKQAAELLRWARKVILRDKVCIRCGAPTGCRQRSDIVSCVPPFAAPRAIAGIFHKTWWKNCTALCGL